MENLTTPKAILIGLSLIAAAIATLPLTGSLVQPANAQIGLTKVQICGENDYGNIRCAGFDADRLKVQTFGK
jgi:hypothetical protein